MSTSRSLINQKSSAAEVDVLVRTHLPLVGHLVRELLGRVPAHVSRDDLISAGSFALVTSAQGFDASRGVPFARFAAIRIRGALTDELRTMDWASRAVRGKAREMDTVRNTLASALGRSPSRTEVAKTMGVGVSELDAVDADVQRAAVLSLHALTSDEGTELPLPAKGDGPENLLLNRERIGYLRDAIAELPERPRTVIEEYFFENRKMVEIAADLGVTESRVSQLRSEALVLLREAMNSVENDLPAVHIESARGRAGVRQAYCASVASRSTMASRLAATTLLGETYAPVAASRLRIAN